MVCYTNKYSEKFENVLTGKTLSSSSVKAALSAQGMANVGDIEIKCEWQNGKCNNIEKTELWWNPVPIRTHGKRIKGKIQCRDRKACKERARGGAETNKRSVMGEYEKTPVRKYVEERITKNHVTDNYTLDGPAQYTDKTTWICSAGNVTYFISLKDGDFSHTQRGRRRL